MKIGAVALLLVAGSLFADDPETYDLGDLFSQTPPDIVADTKPQAAVDTALLTAPLKFSGLTTAAFGILSDGRSASGLYSMQVDLTMDSRPSPVFRLYGTLTTELLVQSDGHDFTTPKFSTLFFDYVIAKTVVIRAGKQTITWGQGRIFNPGDLMSDSEDGASVKVFVPVFGQSLTGVVLGNSANYKNQNNPSWREFTYAMQLTGDLGPISWGMAGRVLPGTNPSQGDGAGTAFLKTNAAGADVFVEGVLSDSGPAGLAGLYWEGGAPLWKIRVETTGTLFGVAVKVAMDGINPLGKWEHSRLDSSGSLLGGIELTSLPLVALTFGIPWVYGPMGSEYVMSNPDPSGRRWSVGLRALLSAKF